MNSGRPRLPLPVLLLSCLVLLTPSFTLADVRLPGYYSSHMVLQQDMPLTIKGTADPGEQVTVKLADHAGSTQADRSGHWQVVLPAMKAGHDAYTLTVSGNNTVTLEDVLIGEVWLCSGQSNMEWPVSRSTNADQEIAAADFPLIRHVKFDRRPSPVPQDDITSQWQVCSPETVASFTAAGYFMARTLHQELNVPIGLVNSSWGGTRIEPWIPPTGFEQIEALSELYQGVLGRTPGTPQQRQLLEQHLAAVESWLASARTALDEGQVISASPAFPQTLAPLTDRQDPTALYNGMIHALVGFPIRGAIWYQGESNHREGMLYYEKKKALVGGWRDLWQQGEFPFYWVQIAPFRYGDEDPGVLAEFWEAQAAAQELPNTGMIVINDIATLDDIHPPNKQDVGDRLALLALKNDYGRDDLVARSPEPDSLEVLDGQLKVHFRNTGGGLKTRDGKSPSHFEVTGPGAGGFHPATAVIDGDAVILSSPAVSTPTAWTFAWHKLAEPNLTGGTGLPVGAARGGEVPSFAQSVPGLDDWTLVYDLDLARLSRGTINWNADHSSRTPEFNRVAYLLELSSSTGSRNVFVSMDAFTDDPRQLGIPTAESGHTFRQPVQGLSVLSDTDGVVTGESLGDGNIEFWPNNYSQVNAGRVSGASDRIYDFGDSPSSPIDGYGCMQVHNPAAKQTVFAINNWNAGLQADIGIGNSPGPQNDWTFAKNAGSWRNKRLRIYVQQTP